MKGYAGVFYVDYPNSVFSSVGNLGAPLLVSVLQSKAMTRSIILKAVRSTFYWGALLRVLMYL